METDAAPEQRGASASVSSPDTTVYGPSFFSSLWPLLRASLRVWLVVVAFWSVLFSLPSMASVHIVAIVGMAVAAVYLRLPPPDEANARAILGDCDSYKNGTRGVISKNIILYVSVFISLLNISFSSCSMVLVASPIAPAVSTRPRTRWPL